MTDVHYERPPEDVHEFLGRVADARTDPVFRGVYLYCTARTGRVVEVRNIDVTGERGTGRGTAAMEALMAMADEAMVDLHIQPSGADEALTLRLERWYARLGFEPCDEPGRMMRRATSTLPSP